MPDYKINLEDKFGSLRRIDVGAEAAAVGDEWVNQTLTTVNDSVIRLGVVEGEFHWHKHEQEDEFFLVLDGRLEIEVDGGETFVLGPQQGLPAERARKGSAFLPGCRGSLSLYAPRRALTMCPRLRERPPLRRQTC